MRTQKINSINFQAGLTTQMRQEIEHCDIGKITKEFEKHQISADFRNNKVVAWCSLKCMQIIENFNKMYDLNLALPKGVFVADFDLLNIDTDTKTHGIHNVAPTHLIKNSDKIIPERTLFFNEHSEWNYKNGNQFWENINEYSDFLYKLHHSSDNSFLNIFLHEFSHSIHSDHLINKLGGLEYLKCCLKNMSPKASDKFLKKYYTILSSHLGSYGTQNLFEAVACDLTNRFIKNSNNNTFTPENNFMAQEPYREIEFKDRLSNIFEASQYDKAIRKCWDGKI